MGGIFNGSKSKSSSQSSQSLVPWVNEAGQQNLALANKLTAPFVADVPTERVARFNNDQLQSFDLTRNYAAQQSPLTANDLGWSHYNTLAQQGPYTLESQGGIPQMGAAAIGDVQNVAAQTFTDADMSAYMNPYTSQVVDASLADLGANYARTLNASDLQQAAGGAFGGGRHGIRDAQVADDYLRNVGSTSSQLRHQAFGTAAGLIQNDQNRALQAAQSNQSANLQRAIQQAQLQQQANSTNADLMMRGRQADISSRYQNDAQRLNAVQGMAGAKQTAQQLADQRILQNAELLAQAGLQQQQQEQAKLDVPFKMAEWRANMLSNTPFPTLSNSSSKSSSLSFGANFK
ncbi:MAG: hypothetical protein RIF37_00605 [Rhodospirillaceae bacterium]